MRLAQALAVPVSVISLIGAALGFALAADEVPARQWEVGDGAAWLPSTNLGGVTLVNGLTGRVDGQVRVASKGTAMRVAQLGTDAIVAVPDDSIVSRVDGSQQVVAELGDEGQTQRRAEGVSDVVVGGGGSAYLLLDSRQEAAAVDPRSLGRLGPVVSYPSSGDAVVGPDGTLWLTEASTGTIRSLRIDGSGSGPQPVADRDHSLELVMVDSSPVVVDETTSTAYVIDPRSGKPTSSSPCIDVVPGEAIEAGGSSEGQGWLPIVVPGAGSLRVADIGSSACPSPIDLGRGGGLTTGTPVVADGHVFVPVFTDGTVVVVDPVTRNVAQSSSPVAEPDTEFELLVHDGLVFFNVPTGPQAGVVDTNGGLRRVTKYDDNESEQDDLSLNVICRFDPPQPVVGEEVTFWASATEGGTAVDVTATVWTFSDRTDPEQGEAPRVRRTFNRPETFTASVEASVGFASRTENCPEIEVMPRPELDAQIGVPESQITVGETVIFRDESGGAPTSWQWTLPDGDPATSPDQHPEVSFATPGTKRISLVVEDATGQRDDTSVDVTVHAPGSIAGRCAPTQAMPAVGGVAKFVFTTTGGNPTEFDWTFTPPEGEPITPGWRGSHDRADRRQGRAVDRVGGRRRRRSIAGLLVRVPHRFSAGGLPNRRDRLLLGPRSDSGSGLRHRRIARSCGDGGGRHLGHPDRRGEAAPGADGSSRDQGGRGRPRGDGERHSGEFRPDALAPPARVGFRQRVPHTGPAEPPGGGARGPTRSSSTASRSTTPTATAFPTTRMSARTIRCTTTSTTTGVADCDDDDLDGVRNALDRCPGHDDKIDVNPANGIPDGCDTPTDLVLACATPTATLFHGVPGTVDATIQAGEVDGAISWTVEGGSAGGQSGSGLQARFTELNPAESEYDAAVLFTGQGTSGNPASVRCDYHVEPELQLQCATSNISSLDIGADDWGWATIEANVARGSETSPDSTFQIVPAQPSHAQDSRIIESSGLSIDIGLEVGNVRDSATGVVTFTAVDALSGATVSHDCSFQILGVGPLSYSCPSVTEVTSGSPVTLTMNRVSGHGPLDFTPDPEWGHPSIVASATQLSFDTSANASVDVTFDTRTTVDTDVTFHIADEHWDGNVHGPCPIRVIGAPASTNSPPVVDAGPDVTGFGNAIISTPYVLSGAASDPDGDNLTYLWEMTSPPAGCSLSNETTLTNATLVCDSTAAVPMTLTVCDDGAPSLCSSDTMTVEFELVYLQWLPCPAGSGQENCFNAAVAGLNDQSPVWDAKLEPEGCSVPVVNIGPPSDFRAAGNPITCSHGTHTLRIRLQADALGRSSIDITKQVCFTGLSLDPNPCPPPPTTPPPTPQITLSQGGPGPVGFWYSVTLSGFTPGSSVTVHCHDSLDASFFTQTFTINASGGASDTTLCYSADGPDHWVTGGGVESNHVTW